MKSFSIFVLFLLTAIGCGEPDEIVSHRIPKSRSNLDRLDRTLRPPRAEAPAVPTRMVVGWVDRTDAIWFFKINGPVDQVNLTEPIWREFLGKLRYDGEGKPEWELPVGWTTGRGSSMRFATLNLNDTTPPLELSISSLGPNQDLLGNVNRWRRQLGLGAIGEDQIEMADIDYDGGRMKLFDEVGLASPGAGGPMMGSGGRPPEVPSESLNQPAKIGFDPIPGWESGPNSSMVRLRLIKNEGDKQAHITVVDMPASANEWAPNIKRWAGEIGMTELAQTDADERTSSIKVDGIEAQRFRLIEDDEKYDRATIAVMVKRGQSAWFIKLSGDKSVVVTVEPDFEDFLTTFKFPDEN